MAEVYEDKWPPEGWLETHPNCEGCGVTHYHMRADLYNKLRAIWNEPPVDSDDMIA